MLPSCSQVVMR